VRVQPSDTAALLLVLLIAWAPRARAQVPSASLADRITGVRGDASRVLAGDGGAASFAEFSDVELYGVPGLRLSGVRVATRVHGSPVTLDVARLGAPVGSHTRATVCAGVESGRWRVALRGGIESLALIGAPGASSIVAAVVSGIDVGNATLSADVESIRDASGNATFLALALEGPVTSHARLLASMRYDGPRALAVGAAAVVPVYRSLSLLAGYDDGTETARLGAVIDAGRLSVTTAAFRHAVLGVSQGASVAVAW